MKWYEREIGWDGQPYPLFLADVVWSAVMVAIVAFVLLLMSASVPALAICCTATAALLGRMIVRRIAEHRASTGMVPARRRGVTPLTGSRQVARGI